MGAEDPVSFGIDHLERTHPCRGADLDECRWGFVFRAGIPHDPDQERAMYELIETQGAPIKAWIRGVPCEEAAKRQLQNIATLPFVFKWVAAMPDVHLGRGSTVGCVIATKGAVIPAAVGVDIGCGMMALQTELHRDDLPAGLGSVRGAIERAVPHGSSHGGGRRDVGAGGGSQGRMQRRWEQLLPGYERVVRAHPGARHRGPERQLGSLGAGNHFIEVSLDEQDRVWFMLHSGSRGPGNRIGTYFITLARNRVARAGVQLADRDLAYLEEATPEYDGYLEAVEWAQEYARVNRELMMEAMCEAVSREVGVTPRVARAINCHHNYVAREVHFGEEVLVTRKGATRAEAGEPGIVPGSMGALSFIVRGRGNPESFNSCAHGAGRAMSRGEAKRSFTMQDHARATRDVESRKDTDVIDETPMAYKPVDAVMAAQADLVEVEHTLRQVVNVKG
jgi:tRNA-splicing ligase RtcB